MLARLPVLFLLLTSLVSPALAAETPVAPTYDRLYLLGGEGDYVYWGPDAADPELNASTIIRYCGVRKLGGVPGQSKPCLMGVSPPTLNHSAFFQPATVLEEPIEWSASAPLRFRLAMSVDTGGVPYTVHFLIQKGMSQSVSAAATEVSPGIWEGALTTGSPLMPGAAALLGVRIITSVPAATLRIGAAGASYVSLPRPSAMRSVPDLIAEDTYGPARSSFTSATHSFRFNDEDWTVRSFQGELGPTRTFSTDLPRDAEALFAWVEAFETPALQDVWRGRGLDRRKLEQGASVTLSRDGETIEHSGSGQGVAGVGIESLAAVEVPAGRIDVSVDAASEEAEDAMPFRVYVLAAHGERTLRSFHSRFTHARSARVPSLGLCPAPSVSVPVTGEVRSFSAELDWDSEAIGMQDWTVRFPLPGVAEYPCGEAGNGDRVRVTAPGVDVLRLGATPSHDGTVVSLGDTVFDLGVTYVYTPPPPPDEEGAG